jgi:hypothetical protein
MNPEEHQEKLGLLSQLIKLARADEEVREIEYSFLGSIAAQLGISEDEFKGLFDAYIAFEPPEFEFDRVVQLHRLVLLMNVDLEIDDEEINSIRNCGLKLGLHPLAVEEILDCMHDYPNKMIPPVKLISIFQTFHN